MTPITWEGTAHCPSSLLMVRLKFPGSNRGSGSVVTGGGGCSSYVAGQDLSIGIVLIPTPLLARGGGGWGALLLQMSWSSRHSMGLKHHCRKMHPD